MRRRRREGRPAQRSRVSQRSEKHLGVASGRAFCSYCTGINHRPVSAPIPNAEKQHRNEPLTHLEYSQIAPKQAANTQTSRTLNPLLLVFAGSLREDAAFITWLACVGSSPRDPAETLETLRELEIIINTAIHFFLIYSPVAV